MTVPIIMLILLAGPYAVLCLLKAVTGRDVGLRDAGVFGLTLLFILTAVGHFADTDSMAQMLPPWVPARVRNHLSDRRFGIRHCGRISFSPVPLLNRLGHCHDARAVFSGKYLCGDLPCTPGRSCVGSRISSHSCAAPTHYLSLGLLVHDSGAQARGAC